MRDAQTLLDQVIAYGGERSPTTTVAEVLDLVDRRVLLRDRRRLSRRRPAAALDACGARPRAGSDAQRHRRRTCSQLLRDLVVLRVAPDSHGLFDGARRGDRASCRSSAGAQRAGAAATHVPRAGARAGGPGLGAAALRGARDGGGPARHAARRATTSASSSRASTQLERRLSGQTDSGPGGGGSKRGGGPVSDRGPRRRTEPPKNASHEPEPFDAPPTSGASVTDIRSTPRASRSPKSSAPSAAAPKSSTPKSSAPRSATPARLANRSTQAPAPAPRRRRPRRRRPARGDLRSPAHEGPRDRPGSFREPRGRRARSVRGDAIELAVAAAFHAERLRARLPELEALGRELFGRPLRISVESDGARAGRNETSESRERSRKRRQEALNSEPVNLAIEVLNAEIVEIRPLGDKP